jgi:hypothetical protein
MMRAGVDGMGLAWQAGVAAGQEGVVAVAEEMKWKEGMKREIVLASTND